MGYLIDLRSQASAIRDQGRRPTCVSFALSACHECLRELSPEELSKDSLHWDCIQIDGALNGGVRIATALSVLEANGQPYEHDWPYIADVDEVTWLSMPQPALDDVHRFKIAQSVSVQIRQPGDLVDRLVRYGPLFLVIPIWESFFIPVNGKVSMPDTQSEELRGSHALCVMGVTTEDDVLVRNSWGESWGDSGYALVPFEYLERHALGLYGLQL